MVEPKQTRRICKFIRCGRWALMARLGEGLTDYPGTLVNARGVFTRMRWRVYRFRPLPAKSLPVLFNLAKPFRAP